MCLTVVRKNWHPKTSRLHIFLQPVKGKRWWRRKKERNVIPLGSQSDIFTLPPIYKVGTSAPPGWHKQKCLCDEPEKTSSIRLYIFVSQLFTQTLRGVRSGPQSDQHTHSKNSWLENSDVCVWGGGCLCESWWSEVSFQLCDVCPSVWPPLSVSTHVLSHVNVFHCLSFSLKPTDQWDPRVSSLSDWAFAQLQTNNNKKAIFG